MLEGRPLADQIKKEVSEEVAALRDKHGFKPCLAAVLVGEDDASTVYVRNKIRTCAEVGMLSEQFNLPAAITLAEATRRFESSAPKYQNLPGLIRKYYIRSEDGRIAGGIYLWESRRAAERVYDGEWRERVEKLYGARPTITWFDSPVVVDNLTGGTITKAA